jgi:predicted acylesterase/phospholipase RssA
VLEVMFEKGIRPRLVYGISSGSLCTAGLCFGSLPFLKTQLLAIRRRSDVLGGQGLRAFISQIFGIGSADGLFSMDKMRKKLDELPNAQPSLKGVVGYVDLVSGEPKYVSSDQVPRKQFLDAVQASCSIPFAMQTQRIKDEVRVDGGVRDILPLKQLIDDSLHVDEIHVVSLSPIKPDNLPIDSKVLPVTMRSLDMMSNEVLLNDLKIAKLYNDLVEKCPTEAMKGKRKIELYEYFPKSLICETIDFNAENIQRGIDHGREIASGILKSYKEQSV